MWRPQSRYTVSRKECRIKFPQNQRCRAKIALHPRKSRCRTFLRTPLSHFALIRSRQGVRRAGGGYRGTFGFRKRIARQGGIAATVTPVALLCATKLTLSNLQNSNQRKLRFALGVLPARIGVALLIVFLGWVVNSHRSFKHFLCESRKKSAPPTP